MEKQRLHRRTNSTTTTAAAAGHLSSPFSENNTSPLRRKSISFTPPTNNKHINIDHHNETTTTTTSNTSTHPLSLLGRNSGRRLQKQSSGDDLQTRGLWPKSKKLNSAADSEADIASAPLPFDKAAGDKGNRSLRYQIGKQQVERSLKKPGTPPSPSTAHSRRLSFSDAGQMTRAPRAAVERPGSPGKGKGGGVGGMISHGFSNLFRRKSFQGEVVEVVGRVGSPGRGSGARESVSAGRGNGTSSRGAAAGAGMEGEIVQKLRLGHNYLIQWRFVNAGMMVVNETKKFNAQRMLMSAWVALSESRFSVAKKRAQLAKEKLKFKLNTLLHHQTKGLERWSAVERHHLAALTSTENSLQAAVCRLPITEHAKVDPNSLTISLQLATNVADAINGTIAKNHSRAQSTALLVAELAQVVAREKLLLEECIELLGLSSSLHVHEESLMSHVIQIKAEKVMECMQKGTAVQC